MGSENPINRNFYKIPFDIYFIYVERYIRIHFIFYERSTIMHDVCTRSM